MSQWVSVSLTSQASHRPWMRSRRAVAPRRVCQKLEVLTSRHHWHHFLNLQQRQMQSDDEDPSRTCDLLNELQTCEEQAFHLYFWWPFHNLLSCYHTGMRGLPFLFSKAAVQNSPLSSRPWTPRSVVREDELIYFLKEEIEIVRQKLLHLPSPVSSNISLHPYRPLLSRRGKFFPKGKHLCVLDGVPSLL